MRKVQIEDTPNNFRELALIKIETGKHYFAIHQFFKDGEK